MKTKQAVSIRRKSSKVLYLEEFESYLQFGHDFPVDLIRVAAATALLVDHRVSD